MEGIKIKNVGQAEVEAAAKMILSIQREEFGVDITLADQPDLHDIDKFYYATGGTFLGAYHGDELVGTIALIGTGHQSGAIRKMFVKETYRGKTFGVAQALLNQLVEYCRTKNILTLYLGTIDRFKAAMRFYERNGFVRVEETDLPGYFPRMKLDHVFYRLNLQAQS